MTPEEVLLESIAAASLYGDSPELRQQQVTKLTQAIEAQAAWLLKNSELHRDD